MEEAVIEAAADQLKKEAKKVHLQHCDKGKKMKPPCIRGCTAGSNPTGGMCCCEKLAQELEAVR